VTPVQLDHRAGIAIAIDDSSQISQARRYASLIASDIGLTETQVGKVSIIASEAASNILQHAVRGEMILRSTRAQGGPAVEMIAIDAGPGIRDLDRAMRDGYSTAGSSGNGLGAMSRMATGFDIFSAPGCGTVIAMQVGSEAAAGVERAAGLDTGVVRVPKRGEVDCGDDWALVSVDGASWTLTVADGLGHGPDAARASRLATLAAEHCESSAPGVVLSSIHAALRITRGAAVADVALDVASRSVRFAGVGNIAAAILNDGASRSLVSHGGIVGNALRKVQEFSYDWPAGALLVVHSDGLSSRWDLNAYPGLAARHPSVVAGVLYRDFSRGRDDALVVVVRAPSDADPHAR
jgi:anti-sigma regulatory factor (Ser/Thr protein kinase)